jgi:antitoxin (DNA-binding transcriptional repressor) of toxin-antitoxin stability system
MRNAGIRELKNRLSTYIGYVRNGETVQVTDRGKVVAELVPPAAAHAYLSIPPGLLEMAARGEIRLPTKKKKPLGKMPRLLRKGSAAELLDWTRGER